MPTPYLCDQCSANALRIERDFGTAILNNSGALIMVLDVQGRIVSFNRACERTTGFAFEEVKGGCFWELFLLPNEILILKALFQQLCLGAWEFPYQFENHWRVKDGHCRLIRLSYTALYGKDGKVEFIIGTGMEITERRRTEEEHRLGVYLVRISDGTIVYTNPNFEKMFGYEPGEMVGQNVSLVNAPDDKSPEETAREIMSVLEQKGVWNGEIRNRKKDGTHFWCTATVSVFDHPDYGKVWLSTHQDITERKQIESKLQESEERFHQAFEHAAIGKALVAPDGHWLKVNHALCELTGYSREELLSKTFQDITHPDDLEADLAYVRQMLAAEIRTYQMEKRSFHKTGRIVWILLNVSLVRDGQGKALYFIAQVQDITERKHAEKERENLIKQLQEAMAQIKTLKGMLPICAGCKKIRDDQGYWNNVESYIMKHSHAKFTHGLCPDCIHKYYPNLEAENGL